MMYRLINESIITYFVLIPLNYYYVVTNTLMTNIYSMNKPFNFLTLLLQTNTTNLLYQRNISLPSQTSLTNINS